MPRRTDPRLNNTIHYIFHSPGFRRIMTAIAVETDRERQVDIASQVMSSIKQQLWKNIMPKEVEDVGSLPEPEQSIG
jgi:hypothetical protein